MNHPTVLSYMANIHQEELLRDAQADALRDRTRGVRWTLPVRLLLAPAVFVVWVVAQGLKRSASGRPGLVRRA
jgi:hypothetical protein